MRREPGKAIVGRENPACFYEGILTMARIENNPERVRNLSQDALAGIGVSEWIADGPG